MWWAWAAELEGSLRAHHIKRDYAPWHFLYFLPLPQGQGSLRPTLAEAGVLAGVEGLPARPLELLLRPLELLLRKDWLLERSAARSRFL
jgi:hypothetical protein